MARGVNKVILVGNLGANPDVRHMPSGGVVTNVRLATTEMWRDKQTGEQQERTEWHRVVFFNRLAEIAGEYLKTGAKVYIEGSLRTRKWRDNNTNADRYTTEIVANDMQILSNRNEAGASNHAAHAQQSNKPFQGPAAGSNPSSVSPQPAEASAGGGDYQDDDDIPF